MYEMVGSPAELLNKLEYDQGTMDLVDLALNYIKESGGIFCSLTDEQEDPEGVKDIKTNAYSYKINFRKTICTTYSKEWSESTYNHRNEVLKKIASAINSSSKLIAQLEFLIREIPQRDALKFDIPLMVQCFDCYRDFESFRLETHVSEKECWLLTFTSKACLFSLGQAVCNALSAGLSVTILATEDTAVLAALFGKLCHQAGIPSKALEVLFVESARLKEVSSEVWDARAAEGTLKIVESKLFNKGCTVVVTESGDIDSAIDLLLSDATFTHVYPWRTNRIMIQESIFEEFATRIRKKMTKNNIRDAKTKQKVEDILSLLPKGAEVWQYYNDEGAKLVLSGNTNWKDGLQDSWPIATLQAFRSTKELLSLLIREPCFALSLWCDSVSISNEISLAANVTTVWINTYAVIDSLVSVRLWEVQDNVYRGQMLGTKSLLPDEEILQLNVNQDEGLKNCLKSLEKAVATWKTYRHQKRLTIILDAIQKFSTEFAQQPEDTVAVKRVAFEVEKASKSGVKSSAVVHGNKLCIAVAEPVGVALVLAQHNNVETLIESLVSIVTGNSLIYALKDSSSLIFKLITFLNNAGVPIVPFKYEDISVLWRAQLIHAIRRFCFPKENGFVDFSLYNEKFIWSTVGESFAN